MNRGISFSILLMGVMGPAVGYWVDRGLVRRLFLIGLVIAATGLIAMSRANELWQLAMLFCGAVAIGTSLFGQTPSMALVTSWFVRRRGLALGVAVAGATLASFAVPPAAALLIETVGWRGALVGMSVAALVIGLPVFTTSVIAGPELVGQAPDGDEPLPAASSKELAEPTSVATRDIIREARLWLLALGFALIFTSPIVMLLSVVPFGQDLGFSGLEAAYFFSLAAPFSLIGKLVFGALADRIPAHPAIWLVVIVNLAVWALLYGDPSYSMFLATGAIYGVGIGSTGPLHGVVLARCYGREAFGRASGIGGLAGLPLLAGVPEISGRLYDASGGYHATFVMMAGLILLGGLLLAFVRIPRT
jgi:sugar phosphate permease